MKANRITKKDGKIVKTQVDAPVDEPSPVRIDPENYQPLVVEAEQEGRSATKHINYILRQHLRNKVK